MASFEDGLSATGRMIDPPPGSIIIKAPMRASVISIEVTTGTSVRPGQTVVVLEAMKMHHVVESQTSGIVTDITIAVDDVVDEDDALLIVALSDEAAEQHDEAIDVDLDAPRADLDAVNARHARLMLIKNPTSLNEAIRTALLMPPPHRLLFLVDDEIDAGGDVSWIWDADLELLSQKADSVVVSGSGAEHLVLRFKHAGVEVTEIDADPDDAFHRAMADMPRNHHLYVLATDAALFELRRELGEAGVIHQFR